jgi:hypothetical protein
MDIYPAEIRDKTEEDVATYYKIFIKKWKTLPNYERIAQRISKGAAKRNKRDTPEYLLDKKISSIHYLMHDLELNYPTTKGKRAVKRRIGISFAGCSITGCGWRMFTKGSREYHGVSGLSF